MTVLGIVANTAHFRKDDDLYVLTRVAAQLDRLGSFFDDTVACVPLHAGAPPANFEPYLTGRVDIRPLSVAGGASVGEKVRLLARAVTWLPRLRQTAREADFLHFRCPCNVTLVALLVLPTSTPWYAMYAGNWVGYEGEPMSYRLQRWLLRRRHNGVVTAYAPSGMSQPDHIVPFYSPTHTRAELADEAERARPKIGALLDGRRPSPLRVAAVGHLAENKNHETAIRGVALARQRGCEVELDVAGDGPLRDRLHRLTAELGVGDAVRLHGVLPREGVQRLNRAAHVNILLSRTEGYPKVVLEGMAAGAAPLLSRFPVAVDLTGEGERGIAVDGDSPAAVADALVAMAGDPVRLGRMAEACLIYARERSLEAFERDLARIFAARWPATFGGLTTTRL